MTWINQDERAGGITPHRAAVPAPTPHDGIGAALRTTYMPRGNDEPDGLRQLLSRLR